MGSGGSVALSGGVKAASVVGITGYGATQVAVGLLASATLGNGETSQQLLENGSQHVKAGVAELARDGIVALSTLTASSVAALTSGVVRAAEDRSFQGTLAAVKGIVLDSPIEVVNRVTNGSGAGGAIYGACLAAHGEGGSLRCASERQLVDSISRKAGTLQVIAEMRISECYGAEVSIWQLAELCLSIYDDPPSDTVEFRCDLPCIRDLEENVDALMAVYIRRGGSIDTDSRKRDLAVLVIRGTLDIHDGKRDLNSILGNEYPADIIAIAAEVVQMYQGQGCEVMVTGHSLGGYIAEVVATTLGLNGVAFCSPGPGEHNGPKVASIPGFHVINHDADNIGNYNHEFHQASPVYVRDGGVLMMPVKAHSIAFMLSCMKKREDWTNLNIIDKCKEERQSIPYHVFDGLRTCRD